MYLHVHIASTTNILQKDQSGHCTPFQSWTNKEIQSQWISLDLCQKMRVSTALFLSQIDWTAMFESSQHVQISVQRTLQSYFSMNGTVRMGSPWRSSQTTISFSFQIFAELYTPPLIPIGFLLDSYIPHGFLVHSTHSYVFPGVPVES